MEQVNLRLQIKGLDEAGKFSGLASTYGNVDLGGDVVVPGAFHKSSKIAAEKYRFCSRTTRASRSDSAD